MKDKKKGLLHLFIIIAIIGLCSYITLVGITSAHKGSAKNIKLGLDLAGGVSITYEATKDNPTATEMKDTIQMMQQRAEVYSTESSVVQVGDNRIEIDIPGVADVAPEFVARQRVGRRWLFRESAGIGYGRYIRSYAGLTGSRGGVGIHESVSAEFMLTRFLGLGVTVGGQWLIVDSPDVDDGAELNLAGIFRVQLGGGIRFYF